MTLKLPSSRPEFEGFSEFYRDELAPVLKRSEARRRRALGEAAIIAASAGLVALAAWNMLAGDFAMIAAFLAGVAGLGAAGARLAIARDSIADDLIGRVAHRLGFDYRRKASRPALFETFRRLKLLPRFNRERWEDRLAGTYSGAAFTLVEVHLQVETEGKNKSKRTVFRGQVLEIDYHREFLGETVVKRDAGLLNGFGKPDSGFDRVGLASPAFEKAFEAWSTDQVEARTLLDPVVLERFQELDRLFDGAKLRAAFTGGKLLIAMEVGDKLSIGTMFMPIEGPARVERILAEIDLIFDLIDVAMKRVSGRIDGAFRVDAVRAG